MSKATTKVNVTINNTKQNVSKILLGQLISDAEGIAKCKYDCIERRISTLKHCMAYNLINSGYHKNHSLASWSSDDFEFRFEYGRRGGCRVSYMNNQGLQSAVFQASEWKCTMDYLKRRIDRIIDRLHAEKEDEIRKAEEERFQRQVISVILDDIAQGKASKIKTFLDIEQAVHGSNTEAHCKCSCTHVAGEKKKDTFTMDELEHECESGDDFVEI